MNKIFGIGLSKTGTSSLNESLNMLGYNSKHFFFNLDEIDNLDAATDLPVALNYKYLDQKYPNSKFILTTRDIESWLVSCKVHFEQKSNNPKINQLRLDAYNTTTFDKKLFEKSYTDHYRDVLKYFKNRSDDLLIFEIKNDGWETLCSFLKKPIPQQEFPYLNQTLPPGIWDNPNLDDPKEMAVFIEFVKAWHGYSDDNNLNITSTPTSMSFNDVSTLSFGSLTTCDDTDETSCATNGTETGTHLQINAYDGSSRYFTECMGSTNCDDCTSPPTRVGEWYDGGAYSDLYGNYYPMWNFLNVPLPTIDSETTLNINKAYITVTALDSVVDAGNELDNISTTIIGHCVDNSFGITCTDFHNDNWVRTGKGVGWEVPNHNNWTTGTTFNTSVMHCVIDEIIRNHGWTENYGMSFICRYTYLGTGDNYRVIDNETNRPVLNIWYNRTFTIEASGGVVCNGETVDDSNAIFNETTSSDGGVEISNVASDFAIEFTETDVQKIVIPYHSDFNLTRLSITGWFKTSYKDDYGTIICRQNGSTERNWWLGIWSGTGQLYFRYRTTGNTDQTLNSSADFADGIWHFYAVTMQTGSTGRLFVDGTEVDSFSPMPEPKSTMTADVIIGNDDSDTQNFVGILDSTRIYRRVLSTTNIEKIRNWEHVT